MRSHSMFIITFHGVEFSFRGSSLGTLCTGGSSLLSLVSGKALAAGDYIHHLAIPAASAFPLT